MRFKKVYLLFVVIVLLLTILYFFDKRIGNGYDQTTKYVWVKDWLKLPDNMQLGNPTGIAIDTNQHIIIFNRAGRDWPMRGNMPNTLIQEKTILIVDKESGEIIDSWGGNLFIMPHGLAVDKDNNVWVTDVGLHQIFKFSHSGQLLMKLGEAKISGSDYLHFNKPTDIAIANDGSFYVSDGYGNSRVIKFSTNGNYLFEWGKKGDSEGEFNTPHGIDIDGLGNVIVADRGNNRIQVFDSTGKFLKQVTNKNFGGICAAAANKTSKQLFAVDDHTFVQIKHRGSDIIILDAADKIQTQIGRSGAYSGPTSWYHDIAVDKSGNIYVGDILGNTVQKVKKINN